MKVILLSLLICSAATAQTAKLSDDYAKAALRIVYSNILHGNANNEKELGKQTDLYVEAEAQASTDTEEQSLKDISLIMNHYPHVSVTCVKELTTTLRHREGTPESCKEYTKL